jgi:hypothetical protein
MDENQLQKYRSALTKIFNMVVKPKYEFVDEISIKNISTKKTEEYDNSYIQVSVEVKVKDEFLDPEKVDPTEFFFKRTINRDLLDGFLSSLVKVGKYIIVNKVFVVKFMDINWYSDGELYDDYGNLESEANI